MKQLEELRGLNLNDSIEFLLGNCIIDYIFLMYTFTEKLRMILIRIPFFNNYINPVILEGDEMILLDCEKTKFPEITMKVCMLDEIEKFVPHLNIMKVKEGIQKFFMLG